MKKVAIFLVIVVVGFGLIFLFPEDTSEIDMVLNRKVFCFKNNVDKAYYDIAVNVLKNNKVFLQDWTYREILNEKYFSNMYWNVEKSSDYGVNYATITFQGTHKVNNTPIQIAFFINYSAKEPTPIAFLLMTNGSEISNYKQFTNIGYSETDALEITDLQIAMCLSISTDMS